MAEALRFLAGDCDSLLSWEAEGVLMGEDVYATTREPPGVERGAFVACGSAGRGLRSGRFSRGWLSSVDEAMRPTPDGVGVKGGGFRGDSLAAFRRFGSGVTGSSGTAKSDWDPLTAGDGGRSVFEVAAAPALRFLAVDAVVFATYFDSLLVSRLTPGAEGTLLVEKRADRRSDMLGQARRVASN
jgi:hypothetical protein